jgi:predicted RNA binding protein YcfA (HicA-like mRNA interferase family)
MTKTDKLLKKAQASPQNLSFSDLCHLTEAYGFEWVHGEGSHRVYGRVGIREVLVFQPGKSGQAKSYQVKQLLHLIGQYQLEA